MINRVVGNGYRGNASMGARLRVGRDYLGEYGMNWYCVRPEEPPCELVVFCDRRDACPCADGVVEAGLMRRADPFWASLGG